MIERIMVMVVRKRFRGCDASKVNLKLKGWCFHLGI